MMRMPSRYFITATMTVGAFACGTWLGRSVDPPTAFAAEPAAARLYELRIYTAAPGKLDALHARFRDDTLRLFEKHGIRNVGYWTGADEGRRERLYYLVAYPDRQAREGFEGAADAGDFFAQLASHWKKQYTGWTAWVLTPDLKLPSRMRLKESRRVPMWNGPIECRLFRFDMVAGSARARDTGAADAAPGA